MIRADMTVNEILDLCPDVLDYLVSTGVDCSQGENLIEKEASKAKVDLNLLLVDLNLQINMQ